MSTAVSTEARIRNVEISDETITAYLVDGHVISVPLAWSWRLSEATPDQRARFGDYRRRARGALAGCRRGH
jgi:hypothetical protein